MASANIAFAEETSISATGYFEKADGGEIPILAKMQHALHFGKIKAPNGRIPGAQCTYYYSTFEYPYLATLFEVDSEANVTNAKDTGGVTPSGCEWDVEQGTANDEGLGQIEVTCDPERELSVSWRLSGTEDDGISLFYTATPDQVGIHNPFEPGVFSETKRDREFTTSCFQDPDNPRGAGKLELFFAASLSIDDDAEISEGFKQVGEVLVDVNY